MMKAGSALGFGAWVVVLGGLGFGLHWVSERHATEQRLREELARQSSSRRVAKLVCDEVTADEEGRPVSSLRWAELDAEGHVREDLPVRQFSIRGKIARIEALQIIFEDALVREGDPMKGKALTLFTTAYGGHQAPADGVPLDVPKGVLLEEGAIPSNVSSDAVPPAYRLSKTSKEAAFEARMWQDFWKMCNDPKYAQSEGVKAVQLTGVGKEMIAGKEYTISVVADGQILMEGPFPTLKKAQ